MADLPDPENIVRVRGDTYPEEWTVKLGDVVQNISGRTYDLFVFRGGAQVFTQPGVVQGSGSTGLVRVTLEQEQADVDPAVYYYRLRQTSAEGTLTVAWGIWHVKLRNSATD
jgi:hypothetical protein